MDEHIVSSRGAYQDRNEFVAEAIWDRINEDAEDGDHPAASDVEAVPLGDPSVGADTAAPAQHELVDQPETVSDSEWAAEPLPLPAMLARRDAVPVLPPRLDDTTIFGLHNRDLPSLWITVVLARLAADAGQPVAWNTVIAALRGPSQAAGEALRSLDATGTAPVKSAVGCPKPGVKARAGEDRLIATALGAPSRSGATGPAFTLGLIGVSDPQDSRPDVAPTAEALQLLADLNDAGLSVTLPQPELATRRWLTHLAATAPAEHASWLSVLIAVGDKPTRSELTARFPHWSGSVADTNTSGYISRAREWGLVEPDLHDGTYRLTPLGEHIVTEGTHR